MIGFFPHRAFAVMLVFLAGGPCLAQRPALQYASALERDLVEAWQAQGRLPGDLARAILIAEGVQDSLDLARYQDRLRRILEAGSRNISPRKRVHRNARALFDYLHREVLRRYAENATLRETLENGTYNCVSSTVLFYLLGHENQIPVELRLTPNHLYAVAYGDRGGIHVETTDPDRGFDFRADMTATLRLLLDYRLISEEELREQGPARVYHEHVQASRPMVPAGLVGVAYGNRAAARLEADDLPGAFYLYEKAMAVDPEAARFQEAYLMTFQRLAARLAATPEQLYPLAHRALELLPGHEALRGPALHLIRHEAVYLAYEKRAFEQAKAVIVRAHERYRADSAAVAALRETDRDVTVLWAISLAGTGHYEEAFGRIAQVYRSAPDNPKLQEVYLGIAGEYATRMAEQGQEEAGLALADTLLRTFPAYPIAKSLFADLTFRVVYARRLLEEDPGAAQTLLLRAHEVDPENAPVRRLLAIAYHELGMERIRKARDYRGARTLVLKGLEFDPENTEIRKTAGQIEDLLR